MYKLMKKGVSLLLAMAMTITILPGVGTLAAEESYKFTVNTVEGAPIIYEKISEGIVEVDGIEPGYEGEATIPEQVQDFNGKSYTVTGIGEEALALHHKKLRSLMILYNNFSFTKLNKLITQVVNISPIVFVLLREESFVTNLKIPSTVQYIEDNAFAYNFKLNSVEIYNVTPPEIKGNPFEECNNLNSIYILRGTKDDYKNAGYPIDYLVEETFVRVTDGNGNPIEKARVTISTNEGYTTKDYTDTNGCCYFPVVPALNKQHNVKVEKDGAEIASVTVPENNNDLTLYSIVTEAPVFTIEENGFLTEYQVTSQGTFPTATLIAGPDKSMGIPYTGTFTVPESVEYNGVTYTVTGIGEKAFENRIGLTEFVISDTVTSIGNKAFYGCLSLSEVTSKSETPAKVDSEAFVGCPSTIKIYIPKGTKAAYVESGWPAEANLVEQV